MAVITGNRRQAREAALGFLYQKELRLQTQTESPSAFADHFKLPDPFRPFFLRLGQGVMDHVEAIDLEIETAAENWKLSRMSKIDLSILRLAVFELFHCPETSHQIIIDEAVELAKEYGNTDSSAFVNGILDRVAKKARSAESAAPILESVG